MNNLDTHQTRCFQDALIGWFRVKRRDLPWRHTGDPYRIWVSEVMLQQTQVATVIPYYERFVGKYPDILTMANAPIDDILKSAESDRKIRTYLGHCLPMIQAAEIASRIPQCTWAIGYRAGPRFDWKDLYSEVTNLKEILMLDARILAADGHYHAALERCLTLRRLARQLEALLECDARPLRGGRSVGPLRDRLLDLMRKYDVQLVQKSFRLQIQFLDQFFEHPSFPAQSVI